jgi:hypothetical protein
MTSLPKPKDRRQVPRYRLARLATIMPGDSAAPRYCLVTNIARGGVRIDLSRYLKLADEFELRFSGDAPAQNGIYRLIWRRGEEVGARFLRKASPRRSTLLKNFSS